MKKYEKPVMELLQITHKDDIVTLSVGVGDGETVDGEL